jgi:hypothetical protein
MINDSLLINRLDTISKQLASIQHDTMSTDASETVKTIALIISPFLVGFILFLLNRNKEYKFKKSDLCGEIYACLEELKMANGGWVTAHINFLGFSRSHNLLDEINVSENDRTVIEKVYQISVKDQREEIEKMNVVIKNLRKYIGVYRFYLTNDKKQELDKLMEPFAIRWSLNYDFSDMNTLEEVNNKLDEITATYIRVQTPIDQQRYRAIINFIDNNETEHSI